jgi:hypothetical protein
MVFVVRVIFQFSIESYLVNLTRVSNRDILCTRSEKVPKNHVDSTQV